MMSIAEMPEPTNNLIIERMVIGAEIAIDALQEQVDELSHLLSPLCRPESGPSGPVVMSIEPPDIKIETEAPLVAKVRSIKNTAESMQEDILQLIDKLTK